MLGSDREEPAKDCFSFLGTIEIDQQFSQIVPGRERGRWTGDCRAQGNLSLCE